MGYWFPTFIVTGGLYAGQTPGGDLSNFISHITSWTKTPTTASGTISISDYPSDPHPEGTWAGAFGSSDEAMRIYGRSYYGQGLQTDIPMMIFTVPNPEGAQYYKQELVVYGSIESMLRSGGSAAVTPPTYWQKEVFNFSLVVTIVRREYATPTSMPVVTDTLYQGAVGIGSLSWIIDGRDDLAGYLVENFKCGTSYGMLDNKKYLFFFVYTEEENQRGVIYPEIEPTFRYTYAIGGIDYDELNRAFGDFKLDENDDPNIDPDPGDDPGDNPPPSPGPRVPEYDPIPIPGMPGLDAIGSGMISLYSPSKTLLNMLADEFYSDNVLDIVKNYFASIQDMVAGLSIIPFFVPVSGFAKHKIGLFESDISLPVVSSQFIEINCGSVAVDHYYNNFLDYAPNTKTMIWLPYIGYQELNTDEVMGNTISVKYKCDILSGACVAFVMIGTGGEQWATNRVIAQFTGNVITQVPVASESFDNMVSSAINILTSSVGIAAGAAIGGGLGAGTAAAAAAKEATPISAAVGAQVGMGMGGTAANMIMNMKPNVSRNGTPGSTSGYMGVQIPYLIKIVPRSAVAPNHIQLKGYPSNYGGTLSGLSGYCEVSEIQLNNVAASVDEINEIYRLLKGGVVI